MLIWPMIELTIMSNIKIQTSSDIEFSRNFTIDDFNSMVKTFDLTGSLMSLQKLGALMGIKFM